MEKIEVITQGYLESYITGDLSPEEASSVEKWIKKDTEVRREYLAVQKLIETLATHKGISPSPEVKRMIMEAPEIMEHYHGMQVSRTSRNTRIMTAASVAVALISALASAYFWHQWQTTDLMLSKLMDDNLRLANSYRQIKYNLDYSRQEVALLSNPAIVKVELVGTENHPDAHSMVYWNPTDKQVLIHSASLAPLPADQQYQLWALVDGKPINAGVFDAIPENFQVMKATEKADAFAITIEPRGGSTAPNLSSMQVIGEV